MPAGRRGLIYRNKAVHRVEYRRPQYGQMESLNRFLYLPVIPGTVIVTEQAALHRIAARLDGKPQPPAAPAGRRLRLGLGPVATAE